MEQFAIEWKNSAKKELKKLPKSAIIKVLAAVEILASEPRPPNSKKLVGADRIFRLKIGEYRVIYQTVQHTLIIEIIRVRHRKDVYRRFP